MTQKKAVIIGAGPAGLTAALEFCRRSDIQPIVVEASHRLGGISCTVRHNGNRMDIGGHRFFSKSDRVMNWWTDLMPIVADGVGGQDAGAGAFAIRYRNQHRVVHTTAADSRICAAHGGVAVVEEMPGPVEGPVDADCVMLVRPRKSRIYFLRSFFDYPLSLSGATLGHLGARRTLKIGISYVTAKLLPRQNEVTLEDFFVNRFGEELYRTFFKSYTEKVWGVPCEQISAAWGAQRIKGLSLRTAVAHFVSRSFGRSRKITFASDLAQKDTETSLIDRFLYPKFGPGQLWEHVADLVTSMGGEIRLQWKVVKIYVEDGKVISLDARSPEGELVTIKGDYFFSTMPVRELLEIVDVEVPKEIKQIGAGLVYRDFITVGLLVDKLLVTEPDGSPLKDTWIYIQEPDVLVGRLQIFNNWSPYMVADPSKTWIGLEYFCYDTDPLWKMKDEDLARFAIEEVAKIGILNAADVRDSHVVRVPKTYPAYFGSYDRFDEIVSYMDRFENLFLVGRNGMHKYNNQDHSMLTAMTAVDNILAGNMDKRGLWEINTEQEYHESKQDPKKDGVAK